LRITLLLLISDTAFFCQSLQSMERQIKLIWDMHGQHAKGTAEHHAIHLKEFAERENIQTRDVGTEDFSEMHSIAFMVVEEKDMITVRDALRPQRAEVAT